MVIAHFVNNDGGVGTVVKNLANKQIEDGNIVYVFTTDLDFSFLKKLEKNIIIKKVNKNYRLPPMAFGNNIYKAFRYLKLQYPNEKIVLHAHNVLTVGVFSRIKKLPLVCTIHGISSINREKSLRKSIQELAISYIIRKMKRNKQQIVGVSEHTSKYYGNISNRNIITIYNGTSNLLPSKANKKEFVFSHLGDISVNKGWDKEIEAYSMLRKKYKERNIKFYYAGKICHMSDTDIKNKVNECGLEENDTKYLGFINNIQDELLRYTDVMLLISKSEGLPMALVESQEMGIPIIATPVGGVPEIVEDNINGFLVEPDIEEIYKKMEVLLLDKEKYIDMCKNSKKQFNKKFRLELMTKKYYDIYNLFD